MKRICIILTGLFVLLVGLSIVLALVVGGVGGHTISPLADKVALIYMQGPIIESKTMVEELKRYGDDGSIKAIILRVDSPGGGVAPSQEIYYEVKRAVEQKPVVVSMGSVAASGGYYVSAPASRIIANPGTLTGSIGVIMEIPNMEGLMDKVGIKTEVIKSGPHKDIASSMRAMKPEERAILQGVIDDVYDQFITDVAVSRGMPVEEVRKLADGRIYTGRQAIDLGLVDELGSLERAIDVSAELAGIDGEPSVVTTKKKKGIFGMLEEKFSASMPDIFPHVTVKYILNP